MDVYSMILKLMLLNINSNYDEINKLKENIIKVDKIITTNNTSNILFSYDYTNDKIVSFNYNIVLISNNTNNIGTYNGNIIVKTNANMLIYPPFKLSKYTENELYDTNISITIDENKVYLNVIGLENTEIEWNGLITLIKI